MACRRKLNLSDAEDRSLRTQYLAWRIPIDQYLRRPDDLEAFAYEWNAREERNDQPAELIHYMMTLRKQKLWERFDGKHERLAEVPLSSMSAEEWKNLIDIYVERGIATDNYLHDESLQGWLEKEFRKHSGRHVWGRYLCAGLIMLRKKGNLPRIETDDQEFNGFDEAAGM